MSGLTTKTFITDNFLLNSKEAEILYHDYAKQMPIIDYHNHLSAQKIAANKPIKNITEVWLEGDHYKWRAMRANGVDEKYITGSSSRFDKFLKWAETVPFTLRNPLFHWTHLELKRYFDIDAILSPQNADEIYKKTNSILSNTTPADLLKEMNVEVICTTDDPIDSLQYHQQISDQGFFTKVYPTFRPDQLLLIEEQYFLNYLGKMEVCVGFAIENFKTLLQAIQSRIDYFHEHGCRLSDYGIEQIFTSNFSEESVNDILKKRLKGADISREEAHEFASCLIFELSKMYHKKGWVQQFHLGAMRNNNSRMHDLIGADSGCDSIGDHNHGNDLSKFFDSLDADSSLCKTIVYNLNPAQNEVFATMMGNYSEQGIPGKMQWGSAWWFLDQKDGMEKQMNTLSNVGLLSRFIGMLTDSRSLLSFPRHEYFRRILCNLLAEDIKNGLVPNDIPTIGNMIQDICYNNAVAYFDFK